MEENKAKKWLSNAFQNNPFQVAIIVIGIIGGVIYAIYKAGKDKGLNTPPSDTPSPEFQQPTVQEQNLFEAWASTTGKVVVKEANDYFESWYSKVWYGGMRDLVEQMRVMTDKQLVWIANDYNRKYYKTGTFLEQFIEHKLYLSDNYDSLKQRLTKLKIK